METKNNRAATIAVVAGVVALLLGLCLGALAGGVGGYLLGRQAAVRQAEEYRPFLPAPEIPDQPFLPQIPELPDIRGMNGALIREVVTNTPAEKAGLLPGDVITRVNDTPIDANHRLSDVIAGFRPGSQVTLEVWRNGRTRSIEVVLGANPDDRARPYLGVYYADLAPTAPELPPAD